MAKADESCCVYVKPKNYATHAWDNSLIVWLLGRSSCSSPSTKELHGVGDQSGWESLSSKRHLPTFNVGKTETYFSYIDSVLQK